MPVPFDVLISSLAADVHGRRMNVIFDRDPTYYYDARMTIEDVERHWGYCELSLECRVKPYKLEQFETAITVLPTGIATVTLLKNVGNTWYEGNTYGNIYGYQTDRLYTWDDFVLKGADKTWANLQKVKLGAQTVSASESAQGIITTQVLN